jgi:hypothetical protein
MIINNSFARLAAAAGAAGPSFPTAIIMSETENVKKKTPPENGFSP